MANILVRGNIRLEGEVPMSGAKNAALPLMVASLLSKDIVDLEAVPTSLADIKILRQLLNQHGALIENRGRILRLRVPEIQSHTAPYELVSQMRASVLVLGPLLARHGQAHVALPGGCGIGSRPIDLHLNALEKMGADIRVGGGYIRAHAPKGLEGKRIVFTKVSVGATENIAMAASLAEGVTEIINAAQEPEVTDLLLMLVKMGARIDGIGSSRLRIEGVKALGGAQHKVIPDRVEAASFAIAAGITSGDLLLRDALAEHMDAIIDVLLRVGLDIRLEGDGIRVRGEGQLNPVNVETEPYPGFPTDVQAQIMALMATANGTSSVTENIFENRFMHVPELQRLGADITRLGPQSALVRGPCELKGAPVRATDIRASVALVIAALAAEGETLISEIHHLDRGYEYLEHKLSRVGASIRRVTSDHQGTAA